MAKDGLDKENSTIEEKIVKRIPITQESYKYLKKMAIDLDFDEDGKITPEMIGNCIDALVKEKIEIL